MSGLKLRDILSIGEDLEKGIEILKFEREFGKRRISKYSKEFIEEICDYGFDNFIKRCNELNINKRQSLTYIFYNLFNRGKSKSNFYEEYDKFAEEYGERFLNSKKEGHKKLCNYGFDKFQSGLKSRPSIDLKKYRLTRIVDLLEISEEELKKEILYSDFFEEFGTKFSQIDKRKRDEIINTYGDVKSFKNKIKENGIEIGDNNLYHYVYRLSLLNKEECKKEISSSREYDLFHNKYGFEFSSLNKEKINELIEFGFYKFEDYIKNIEWLKDKSFDITRDFYNKSKEDLDLFLLLRRGNELGINLSKINKKKLEVVANIGLDKLLEIVKRRGLSDYYRGIHIIILEFMNGIRIHNEGNKYVCQVCGYKKRLSILTEQRMNFGDSNKICERCFPKNYSISSFGEREVFEFIYHNYSGKILSGARVIDDNKGRKWKREIDIYLIHEKIGFEYNGEYFHGTELSLKRDNEKIEQARKQGIKIYSIKEEDWKNNNEKEKERIINILKKEKIYSPRSKEEILNVKGQIEFKDLNFRIDQLDNEYELVRFSRFFGKESLENMTDDFKDEIKLFGFEEIKKRIEQRNIDKDFLLKDLEKNLKRYVLSSGKNYLFNIEDDKFKKEFGIDYFSMNMFEKEKLTFFGFDEFVKIHKKDSKIMDTYKKIYKQKEL